MQKDSVDIAKKRPAIDLLKTMIDDRSGDMFEKSTPKKVQTTKTRAPSKGKGKGAKMTDKDRVLEKLNLNIGAIHDFVARLNDTITMDLAEVKIRDFIKKIFGVTERN